MKGGNTCESRPTRSMMRLLLGIFCLVALALCCPDEGCSSSGSSEPAAGARTVSFSASLREATGELGSQSRAAILLYAHFQSSSGTHSALDSHEHSALLAIDSGFDDALRSLRRRSRRRLALLVHLFTRAQRAPRAPRRVVIRAGHVRRG